MVTTAEFVWNGYEVSAELHCECGCTVEKDIDVRGVIECPTCHRIWKPIVNVACVPATQDEVDRYLIAHYGADGAAEWKARHR